MISLGCPKNQVDAEIMLKAIQESGFEITKREDDADAIIINTCGFLESAAEEAIETILEIASYKTAGVLKALIVTGCLAERYKEQITEEIPEVDVVVGLGKNSEIVNIIKEALKGNTKNYFDDKMLLPLNGERLLFSPPYTAYLKIAEGCSNNCSYCAIPSIRGPFRSRTIEDIIKEANTLAQKGVKEIILVAQDTTLYGIDLYKKPCLSTLLAKLCEVKGIEIIRTLYTYPDRIDDELIKTVAENKKIAKYFDIPLQHCEDKILKAMNRRTTKADIKNLIDKLRKNIPDVILRTSLITGFPGETEEDFMALAEFVKDIKFDRLGCFPFSNEEGTKANTMDNQIDKQTRFDRAENIMNLQLEIVTDKNKEKIGKTYSVLVEGYDSSIKAYFGRSYMDAPEIDGKIFFTSKQELSIGDSCNVLINDFIEYDLLGEKI